MTRFDIFDTIDRLRREGAAFCVATVVRTADVTSAKAGAKAAVTEGGEILGHLGGACVAQAVAKAAALALEAGTPQMIRVKPSDKVVAMQDADGAALYKSGCPSGGTVDILIEPYDLPPVLAIFGVTPIAEALMRHARLMDLRVEAGRVPLTLGPRDFAVIASQGVDDAVHLKAALESAAGHIQMIASARKADALRACMMDEGVGADRLRRLKSPAGLFIGAIQPDEIAISLLAEITQWRRSGAAGREPAAAAPDLP